MKSWKYTTSCVEEMFPMRLVICPCLFLILFVTTVSQGDPWSSTWEPPCCVWLGFPGSPCSQPLLLAAPRLEAVLAWLDCRSGARLKCMLQTFIQTCLKLSSSRQMQGSRGCSFYVAVQGVSLVHSFSFMQLCWSGFIRYSVPCPKAG